MTLRFSGGRSLVINPMLTGALQHCAESERVQKATCMVLGVGSRMDLRYLDGRQMGKVYYINATVESCRVLQPHGRAVLGG